MKTNKMNTRKMPIGTGKTEFSLSRIAQLPDPYEHFDGMLVFSRSMIEAGDISAVITQLGHNSNPNYLRAMAGATIITVEGYAEEDSEIYEIPAVRKYFRTLSAKWSPWLFAGTIFTADLFAIVLACLPSVTCIREDGEITVFWKLEEMEAFLRKSLPTAAWLHNRAGVVKEDGCAMLKAAAAYLGLPFSEGNE